MKKTLSFLSMIALSLALFGASVYASTPIPTGNQIATGTPTLGYVPVAQGSGSSAKWTATSSLGISGGGSTPAGTTTNVQYNLDGTHLGGISGSTASSTDQFGNHYDVGFQYQFPAIFNTTATNFVATDSGGADVGYSNPTTIIYRLWSISGAFTSGTYIQTSVTCTMGGVVITYTPDTFSDVTGYVIAKSTDGGITWQYSATSNTGFNGSFDDADGGSISFPESSLPGNSGLATTYLNAKGNPSTANVYGIYTTQGAAFDNESTIIADNGFIGINNTSPQAPIDFNVPNGAGSGPGQSQPLFYFSDSAGGSADIAGLLYDPGITYPAVWWELANNAGSGVGQGGFRRPMDFMDGFVQDGYRGGTLNGEIMQAISHDSVDDNPGYTSGILGLYSGNDLDPDSGQPTERDHFAEDGSGWLSTNNLSWDSSGNLYLSNGGLKDSSASLGSLGNILTSTGSQTLWTSTSTLLASLPAVTSYNGTATQGLGLSPTVMASTTNSKTGAYTLFTYTPTATSTFDVGAAATVNSVALDVIQLQVTYTDPSAGATTATFFPQGLTSANLASTGVYPMPSMTIVDKKGSTITVKATLTTGTGSINYNFSGWLRQIANF